MNQPEKNVATLLELFGMCAKLAPMFEKSEPSDAAKSVFEAMREEIEALWSFLADLAAERFPGAKLAGHHPGYVVWKNVLVPFYLLQDLPGTSELAELTALGESIRLTKAGMVCLSGSTALLGTLKYVGDIDYCEYGPPDQCNAGEIAASAGAHAGKTNSPLCERIKLMKGNWAQDCASWSAEAQETLKSHIEEGEYQLKLDFISDTKSAGPAEATNMVLLLFAGREYEIVKASFAAQEVPIPGSVLPRPLCDPLQLGRYINFLIEQVRHYADENPVKALKRALSLERILMLSPWDDRLIAFLQDPRAGLTAAYQARSKLLERLESTMNEDAARAQTREKLRDLLEDMVADLEKLLESSRAKQASTKDATTVWASEIAIALTIFLQDAQLAIAAT